WSPPVRLASGAGARAPSPCRPALRRFWQLLRLGLVGGARVGCRRLDLCAVRWPATTTCGPGLFCQPGGCRGISRPPPPTALAFLGDEVVRNVGREPRGRSQKDH